MPLPKSIITLRDRYQLAQRRLIQIIAAQEARGNVTAYRRALLAQVDAELSALDKFAIDWVHGVIPPEYKGAAEDVYKYFNKIPASLVSRSEKATEIIMNNAIGELTDASQYVGRVIKDEARQAGIDATQMKLTAGDTAKQMQKNLVQLMTDRGIVSIRDKRGHEIKLDSYAEMVSRTTVRETTNLATINEMQEIDEDLVQFTSHAAACPICAPIEGKVFSITGKDKRYPALDSVFPGGYHTLHPRCAHSVTPYIEDYDDNAEKTRKFSNTKFDSNSPEAKQQLDRYYADQKVKTARRNDRNQWEQYKQTLPDDTPKTLSGFRASKRADSEKWKNLQGRYRDAREVAPIIPIKPAFVPAKTTDEAKAYMQRFCKGDIKLRGVDLDIHNAINKSLYENDVGGKVPKFTRITAKSDTSKPWFAQFHYMSDDLDVNTATMGTLKKFNAMSEQAVRDRKYLTETLARIQTTNPKLYAQGKRALEFDRDLVGTTPEDMITHEIGHHIQFNVLKDNAVRDRIFSNSGKYVTNLSAYADYSGSEYFAESYNAYKLGMADKLDPEFVAFIKGVFK
jgi:hypothetical protein